METDRPIHPFSRNECHIIRHTLDVRFFDIIDHIGDQGYGDSYVDVLVMALDITEAYRLLWCDLTERREVAEQAEHMREITQNAVADGVAASRDDEDE